MHLLFCLLLHINQPFWLHQALPCHLDKFKPVSSGFLNFAPENDHLPFSLFLWTRDKKQSQTSVGGVSNTLTSKGPGVGRKAMLVILWKSTSLSNSPMDSLFLLFACWFQQFSHFYKIRFWFCILLVSSALSWRGFSEHISMIIDLLTIFVKYGQKLFLDSAYAWKTEKALIDWP